MRVYNIIFTEEEKKIIDLRYIEHIQSAEIIEKHKYNANDVKRLIHKFNNLYKKFLIDGEEISLNDINSNFFHFTWKNNLVNIEEKGLLPKKGLHAKYIEETEKVFFVHGLDNLLILFDCWINVYKKVPLLPKLNLTYGLGSKVMRSKYFPMFLVDFYFLIIKNSKRHKRYAYKIIDKLLDECILLQLDLEEKIDFDFADIDQIKARGFRKRHLIELGYSEKYSDMDSNKMDNWNLHTLTNKGISPSKLKLCSVNNSTDIRDILNFILKNTKLDLKDICPNLYDYLNTNTKLSNELKDFMLAPSYQIIKAKNVDNNLFVRKYGSFGIAFHEVGIVYDEQAYILIILTQKNELTDNKKVKYVNKVAKKINKIHKLIKYKK